MLIKRRKHIVPELNTTSTADISFMLLTFFLVTTSMDVDRGLVRQLPPLDNDKEQTIDATEVSRENTMDFKLTDSGTLLLNDKPIATKNLRLKIADFIRRRPTQHVIYVNPDPAASYNAYFQLEDEIMAAYNSVRNEMAQRHYHRPYAALNEKQRNHVRDLCPQHISETYNTTVATPASDSQKPHPPSATTANNKEGGKR